MSDGCAGDNERAVYLAEAGESYEPAYERAVFDTREKAEKWLGNLDPEEPYIDSYGWSRIEKFVINTTDRERSADDDAGDGR